MNINNYNTAKLFNNFQHRGLDSIFKFSILYLIEKHTDDEGYIIKDDGSRVVYDREIGRDILGFRKSTSTDYMRWAIDENGYFERIPIDSKKKYFRIALEKVDD